MLQSSLQRLDDFCRVRFTATRPVEWSPTTRKRTPTSALLGMTEEKSANLVATTYWDLRHLLRELVSIDADYWSAAVVWDFGHVTLPGKDGSVYYEGDAVVCVRDLLHLLERHFEGGADVCEEAVFGGWVQSAWAIFVLIERAVHVSSFYIRCASASSILLQEGSVWKKRCNLAADKLVVTRHIWSPLGVDARHGDRYRYSSSIIFNPSEGRVAVSNFFN